MKLQQRQVADPRAQENFEQLQLLFPLGAANIASGAVTATKLATGIVLELAVTGTRRKVAFGGGSVTFSASTSSATVTVAHGLGVVPARVTATGSGGAAIIVCTNSYDATNIVFHADYFSALTGNFTFDWIAIG